MNTLILLCAFPFTGSFATLKYYVPARLIEKREHTYVVDLSAEAERMRITDLDYRRYVIDTARCYFKSDLNATQEKVNLIAGVK